MKVFIIVMSMMGSLNAFASDSFTGTWTATNGICSATFEITQTETSFKIGPRIYDCGDYEVLLSEQELIINNGIVFYNDVGIGVANHQIIKYAHNEATFFNFVLYPTNDKIEFQEGYNNFQISGKIVKQE